MTSDSCCFYWVYASTHLHALDRRMQLLIHLIDIKLLNLHELESEDLFALGTQVAQRLLRRNPSQLQLLSHNRTRLLKFVDWIMSLLKEGIG